MCATRKLAILGVVSALAGVGTVGAEETKLIPDLGVVVGGFNDSNPEGVTSGRDGVAGVFLNFTGDGILRMEPSTHRYIDFGLDFDLRTWQHGENRDLEIERSSWALRADADIFSKESGTLKRFTAGILVERRDDDRGNEPSSSAFSLTPAFKWTFTTQGICDLTNLLVYGTFEDHDDDRVVDPALDRGGDYTAAGAEFTSYHKRGYDPVDCDRAGAFRKWVPSSIISWSAGYRYDDRDTDGLDVSTDSYALYGLAHLPLTKKLSLEPRVRWESLDFVNSDDEETSTTVEVKLLRHFLGDSDKRRNKDRSSLRKKARQFDLFLGFRHTGVDFEPGGSFDRNLVFAGLAIAMRDLAHDHTGSGGSSVDRGSGSSGGSSDPVVGDGGG